MANQSLYNAFERFWMHVVAAIGDKADVEELENLLPENTATTEEVQTYLGIS